VPSLVTGGLLAIALSRATGQGDTVSSACAVIGMGSMFASVMHLPLTGAVIILELTGANVLLPHVLIANFIACNIEARLPHGGHSFVHLCLETNETWLSLDQRDFIETDEHEETVNLAMFKLKELRPYFMPDSFRMKIAFDWWANHVEIMKACRREIETYGHLKRSRSSVRFESRDGSTWNSAGETPCAPKIAVDEECPPSPLFSEKSLEEWVAI